MCYDRDYDCDAMCLYFSHLLSLDFYIIFRQLFIVEFIISDDQTNLSISKRIGKDEEEKEEMSDFKNHFLKLGQPGQSSCTFCSSARRS